MRYLYLFFVMISLLNCKAKSGLASVKSKEVEHVVCPENGSCSYEIHKNKTLQIKTDNLGDIYPNMIIGNDFVIKFEYKKAENTNYQDNGYREEVFIELDKDNLELETTDLKSQNLLFARWCYCKGQTGYYKINKGELSITKMDDKNFKLHLSFTIDEVPQIINEINYTFNLD